MYSTKYVGVFVVFFWSFAWNAAFREFPHKFPFSFKLPCVLKGHDHISEWKSDNCCSFVYLLLVTVFDDVCMRFPRQLLLYGGLDQQIFGGIPWDSERHVQRYQQLPCIIPLNWSVFYELKWNEQWVPVFVAVRWCMMYSRMLMNIDPRSQLEECLLWERVQWKLGPTSHSANRGKTAVLISSEHPGICKVWLSKLEFQRYFYWGKSYRRMMSMKYPVWLCHEVLTAFFTAGIWRNCDCPTERRLKPPM